MQAAVGRTTAPLAALVQVIGPVPAPDDHERVTVKRDGRTVAVDYVVHVRWGHPVVIEVWLGDVPLLEVMGSVPTWASEAAHRHMVAVQRDAAEEFAVQMHEARS